MTTPVCPKPAPKVYRQRTWRPQPWPLRGAVWMMIAVQVILPFAPALFAATATATGNVLAVPAEPQFATPPPEPVVTVNRTVPQVTAPTTELVFSASPSAEEISRARVFEHPIVALGKIASTAENKDLAAALLAYRSRQDKDDASAIENFLQLYPDSPRYISLSANLAAHYRRTSQFSKALTVWQQIWTSDKDITDVDGRQIVDQAVGDWATFLVTLGRLGELKVLLQEVQGRDFHGAAAVRISDAANAVWQMEHLPQKTFKCGPYSLSRIQNALDPSTPVHAEILSEESNTNGTSLYQNWVLAQKMGLKYQMAKRQPGAEIPLPAMVHWKLGHFSALIKMQDGSYRIEDPTFTQGWISPKVLDEEADCFLIPDGALPSGWSPMTGEEAKTIFGRSAPQAGNPDSPSPPPPSSPGSPGPNPPKPPPKPPCNHGMAGYYIGMMRISLTIVDTPLFYAPPRGPSVGFGVTYAERSVYQSGPFTRPNLGNQWSYDWLQYISDNTTQPNADVKMVLYNGNAETFTGFNTNNNTYAIEQQGQEQLTKTSGTSYQCLYPDGSIDIFSQPENTNGARRVYITKRQDSAGNALIFRYDSNYRLTNVIDAIGQVTTVSYELTNDIYKITKVTDPFGRFATFKYNASGQLTNITDTIGISSAFAYGTAGEADFINALTTPYGTTTFAVYTNNFNGRSLVITDPLGGQERAEFTQNAPGVNNTDPANLVPSGLNPTGLNFELAKCMSFFWDKKAMASMPGALDYTKAKQYVWDRTAADFLVLSSTLQSSKQPLENARVWYNYPGQSRTDQEGTIAKPSVMARVLDDGTTQLQQYQYNAIGKPTKVIDPVGRTTFLTYSTDNIDLLSVSQLAAGATNLLGKFTYNSLHLPLTAVDAAGLTNFFGYNTNGQLVAMTNAINEIVLLNYSTNGYLTNIVAGTTSSFLSTNSFTYDGYGRVRTVTDPLGYTITTSYDAFDRPTNITYMDGTYQQRVYDKLDAVLSRDRRGHWTSMAYDPLRHLTDTYDGIGRHTQFGWCSCGSLESITDPLGRVTAWTRDLQNRVKTKIYPDTTQISYVYATNNSRLISVTDAKNQATLYSYFVDNKLQQATYSNALVVTPNVSFTYDTNYNRMVTMTDGTGTTTYRYYNVTAGQLGAGQLSSVSNSFIGSSSVVSYNYDGLGRIISRAINGAEQRLTFDALHRVTVVTNLLGRFTNTYVGATMHISTNFAPFGKATVFSYLSVTNDERLAEIWNQKTNGVTLSKFDYFYDADGQITNWTQQADATMPTVQVITYDPVDQLLSATVRSNTVAGAILKQFAYGYDAAGNRTGEQIGGTNAQVAVSLASYNSVNQLTSRTGDGGQILLAGSLNEQGGVMIASNTAVLDHFTTNFFGYMSVTNGTNVIPVIATDYSANSRTNKYQVVVTNNGVAKTITYDLNGNETNVMVATLTNSYQFDAANRLVTITSGTNQSLFTYDGLGRRVQIIEKRNGVAVSTNLYLWCRTELCEERNNTGATVTKRFFGGGEQISGTNYYFTRDHLGSMREMVDSSGEIQARYDYDPYGRRTKISGSLDADFCYAGMYYHAVSGLNLTLYRAYDPDLGRWLSRDPIGEVGGLNIYEFVGNNPIAHIDSLGLAYGDAWDIRTYTRDGFDPYLHWLYTGDVNASDDDYAAALDSWADYFNCHSPITGAFAFGYGGTGNVEGIAGVGYDLFEGGDIFGIGAVELGPFAFGADVSNHGITDIAFFGAGGAGAFYSSQNDGWGFYLYSGGHAGFGFGFSGSATTLMDDLSNFSDWWNGRLPCCK